MSLSAQNDRGIDHIAGARDAAKLTGGPRPHVVESFDRHRARAQQPGESSLPTAIAPNLTYHARGYRDR